MSGLLIKPGDRSALMLRSNFPDAGYSLSHVHHASLDLDLGDFMFFGIFNFTFLGKEVLIVQKTTGVAGYMIQMRADNSIRFRFYTAPGAVAYDTPANAIASTGWHIIIIFGDRDGNIYFYIDGTLFHSANMAGSNVDQSVNDVYYLKYNNVADRVTYSKAGLAGWQHYNFGVGGISSVTERVSIVAQYLANPWDVAPVLSARANYTTEKRCHLNFENLDPAWNYIPDVSAYANNMSLRAGALVSTTVKEFMAP